MTRSLTTATTLRERYESGQPVEVIAADLGISVATIYRRLSALGVPRRKTPTAATFPHGTANGYRRHQYAGARACDPCKAAWAAYCKEKAS